MMKVSHDTCQLNIKNNKTIYLFLLYISFGYQLGMLHTIIILIMILFHSHLYKYKTRLLDLMVVYFAIKNEYPKRRVYYDLPHMFAI